MLRPSWLLRWRHIVARPDAEMSTTGGKIAFWLGFLLFVGGVLPRIDYPLGIVDSGNLYLDFFGSLGLILLLATTMMVLPVLLYAAVKRRA